MANLPLLQNKHVGSTNEYNVAIGLERLHINYAYQYQIGIQGVRGSKVIDFLAYTVPKPTPIFVHGRYWHGTKERAEDQLKFAEITSTTRNQWFEPIIIWEEDSNTVDDAVAALRKALFI